MPSENRLRGKLENLVAEILAADSSDAQLFERLITKIEALCEAVDAGPAEVSALTESCRTLRAVDSDGRADALGAVAERLMDLASTTNGPAETTSQEPEEPDQTTSPADESVEQPSTPAPDNPPVAGAPAPSASPAGEALSSLADPELLKEYVAESLEHVVAAEEAVLALEADSADAEQINTI
ncbi:MAG: hypothetical protein ACYTFO_09840, partial [Planctomycetota bacterium]